MMSPASLGASSRFFRHPLDATGGVGENVRSQAWVWSRTRPRRLTMSATSWDLIQGFVPATRG
jgi:hypothetical protein